MFEIPINFEDTGNIIYRESGNTFYSKIVKPSVLLLGEQ